MGDHHNLKVAKHINVFMMSFSVRTGGLTINMSVFYPSPHTTFSI